MGDLIAKPFAALLIFLYNLVNNYGIAILIFAVIVRLILLPFQMKSKRGMLKTSSLQPRLKEAEKKFEGNQQKIQEEMARIYKEEGVNPMSGCLWSFLPLFIMLPLYSVIRRPLTSMMGLTQETVDLIQSKFVELGLYEIPAKTDAYLEIHLADLVHQNFDNLKEFFAGIPGIMDLDFSFLGMNLGSKPQWNFFMNVDWGNVGEWLPALGLFLIPLIAGGLGLLQSQISMKTNPVSTPQQGNMKTMMYMMPLMSVMFCFWMPAAMGIYWIAGSMLMIIQDIVLNKHYGKIIEAENAERYERDRIREAELEAKRQETERRRAAGETMTNRATSKKKLQNKEKQKMEKRAAEINAQRRAEQGIPDSQSGNRRYARGRAYVADRYTNPESAEEATLAAAMESQDGESIDTEMQEELLLTSQEENMDESPWTDDDSEDLEDEGPGLSDQDDDFQEEDGYEDDDYEDDDDDDVEDDG